MQVAKCDLPSEAQNVEPQTRLKLIKDPSVKRERPIPFEKLRIAETAIERQRPVLSQL